MQRLSLKHSLLSVIPFALVACSSTNDWTKEPGPETPATFESASTQQVTIQESLLQLFDNEQLNAVVHAALENNPDLLRAQARMEESGYALTATRSALFPSLSASANGGYTQPAGGAETETYAASLDARWEVDIWGRVRSSAGAAKADFAALSADFNAARQSLAAQTMQAWFSLVSAEKLLDLDTRRVASFDSTFTLIERRFDLGEVTLSELDLARTDFENAKADLEASKNKRDQAARLLKTIAGEYPTANYTLETDWPALDRSLEPGIPSELLINRPDIQAAYQRLLAADKRITVTQAQLFPSFVLTATGGRRSNTLSDLSDSAFDSWTALANIAFTLFDAGQRNANISAANKRAEQAYYSYQSVVLNALRETENAISSENYLASEEQRRLAALAAARRSYERAQKDYEAGLSSILALLETQRRVFNTERSSITLHANRLSNRVSLALALGKAN